MLFRFLPSGLGFLIGVIALLIVIHVADKPDLPAVMYTMRSPENLVLIPANTFEKRLAHPQTVHVEAFYIGRYDVTNAEYGRFLNDAVRHNQIMVEDGKVYLSGQDTRLCDTRSACEFSRIVWNGSSFSVYDDKENHPMVCVCWEGAAAYCNWLSLQEGYLVCYDSVTWKCNFEGSGFRLPTENEWAYAAYGGQSSLYPWGDEPDSRRVNMMASGDPFEWGPKPWTTPVGFYNGSLHGKAEFNWPGEQTRYQTGNGMNLFGLSDITGNVSQWCNDPDPNQNAKPNRILHGGSWADTVFETQGNAPLHAVSERACSSVGFRVVLPVKARMEALLLPGDRGNAS